MLEGPFYSTMRNGLRICRAFAALLLAVPGYTQTYYLFAYFIEPAETRVYYALSADGYRWNPLNGGNAVIRPGHPGELMRDIFITRGPDRQFHAVWTWGWRKSSIGYAHSSDLVHWSDQREIPLMTGVPGTVHTWAPEIYWDKRKSQWLIVWSSIAEGQTRNRIYCSFTSDFSEFSRPAVFFDPGYDVIDATILKARRQYYLIFKDQTRTPLAFKLRLARSRSLEGPFTNLSDTFTESWSEGPSALHIGHDYFVYYDHYRALPGSEAVRYEAVRSPDLVHWVSIKDRVSFPKGCKHGSFLKLTQREAARLQNLSSSTLRLQQ